MAAKRCILVLLMVGFFALTVVENAWAIPPFARKYQTSCATCHEAFPRVNAVGEAFRLNGYKFREDDAYIKEEPVEMGDQAYKRVWPDAIWPSDIPGLPPITLILDSQFQYDAGGSKDAKTQFVFPKDAKLLAAGALGDSASMFVELHFSRAAQEHGIALGDQGHGGGHDEESGTTTEVEGWLQFEDIIGPENAANVRVGTVGMQEMGLFTARNHNRLTANPYLYTMWQMYVPGHHAEDEPALIAAVGDEGEMHVRNEFTLHDQPGVELNGFGRRWRYAVGITNGNGESAEDNNSAKDYYFQLAYKLGGIGFDGSGGSEGEELQSAESWRDDSVILSLFGYNGTSEIKWEGEDDEWEGDDDFWRLGIGAQRKIKDVTLNAGYVVGRNNRPFGALTDESVDSESWFVEAQYFLYPWLIPNVRYETVSLDLPSGVEGIDDNADNIRRVVPSVTILLRANVKLIVEGRFYTNDDRFETGDRTGNQVVVSLSAAF